MSKPFIVGGDKTDHGGVLIEGAPATDPSRHGGKTTRGATVIASQATTTE
jgi:uncharacterized Zn-binding protein involved in type VI secretion